MHLIVLSFFITANSASTLIDGIFDIYENKRLDSKLVIGTEKNVRSKQFCAAHCLRFNKCWSAYYNRVNGDCVLSQESPRTDPLLLIPNQSYVTLHNTAVCREDWIEGTDKCYFISDTSLSWEQAKEYCNSYGSNLVEIHNKEKIEIFEALFNSSVHFTHKADFFWTGGKRKGSTYFWTSNNTEITDFHWNKGQTPSSSNQVHTSLGGQYDKFCIEMSRSFHFSWHYARCSDRNSFVCERSKN